MTIFLRVLVIIACFICGYLLGSIPNGVIISELFYGKDPRKSGSHNTGGTNVLRTVSKKSGIATVALDVLKVLVPFLVVFAVFTYCEPAKQLMLGENTSYTIFGQGNTLAELTYYITALGGMIGHAYSCFIGFKGGKIVSCFCGYALCVTWTAIPLFLPIFFIVLKLKKYVSLSSLSMCGAFTIFTWIIYLVYALCGKTISGYLMFSEFGPHASIYLPLMTTLFYLLMVFKHRENIKRIINHTENKMNY